MPIQRFAPSSTQVSPSRRAVVSRATESDPWSGSVSAKAPIISIRAIRGSQRSFCSSEPKALIEPIASPECTPKKVLKDPSPRASSIDTRAPAMRLMPGQPYPSMTVPATFSSASLGTSSNGNSARSQ